MKIKVTLQMTVGQSISKFWCQAPSGAHDQIFITVWHLRSCFCGVPSLTRGRVCFLYVPLALASAVFLGFSSLGTWDRILLLRFETSSFVASYDSQGNGGGIRPRLHTGLTISSLSLSLMLRPTVSRPVCLGIRHQFGAYDQIFFFRSEYVWQLRSWFRGAPSLTRGRVCLLYVPLVLTSAVFLGPSPLGLATVFYCLRFETSINQLA
jgi:hypothetical protein